MNIPTYTEACGKVARIVAVCTIALACSALVQTAIGACPADLNRDAHVGISDLMELLGQWGPCPESGACPADLDGDGEVDGSDLFILLTAWGECPMEGGCVGYCGNQSPYGWCDDACVKFGDCVWNACAACVDYIPDCERLPEDSCQYRCGGMAPAGCWCDVACPNFGDCCDDVCEHCDSQFNWCP